MFASAKHAIVGKHAKKETRTSSVWMSLGKSHRRTAACVRWSPTSFLADCRRSAVTIVAN
jgi:hypothetical protein